MGSESKTNGEDCETERVERLKLRLSELDSGFENNQTEKYVYQWIIEIYELMIKYSDITIPKLRTTLFGQFSTGAASIHSAVEYLESKPNANKLPDLIFIVSKLRETVIGVFGKKQTKSDETNASDIAGEVVQDQRNIKGAVHEQLTGAVAAASKEVVDFSIVPKLKDEYFELKRKWESEKREEAHSLQGVDPKKKKTPSQEEIAAQEELKRQRGMEIGMALYRWRDAHNACQKSSYPGKKSNETVTVMHQEIPWFLKDSGFGITEEEVRAALAGVAIQPLAPETAADTEVQSPDTPAE